MSTAVLLIAHGSRRSEANHDLLQLAEILRAKNLYTVVETAYLELAQPDIPAGGERCVALGASTIKLLPYFLSAGAHVVEDLEQHRRALAARFPHATFELCPPLGLHPLMIDIILDRLHAAAAKPDVLSIDVGRFNNDGYIDARIAAVPAAHQGSLRSALSYLYNDHGPVNLPRDRLLAAEPYFELVEKVVIRWMYTRTNGRLRSTYGAGALSAARQSRYRCEVCGIADVRTLNIDHVDGRIFGTPFACLCANCHAIKSRESDWTGEKPVEPPTDDLSQ